MKMYKGKCQTVHLGQDHPRCVYSLGNEGLESSAMERALGALVDAKSESAVPWQPGGTSLSWGHQGQHSQPGKGGVVLLCSGLGQPHLEGWGQLWVPQRETDLEPSDSVQRRPRGW